MPVRRKNEKLEDYVQRCIMVRRAEHPNESNEQSVAICYSMGKTWWKKKVSKKTK